MIVKDEADWILQCIESVKDLVSEIIIVDTGSKDNTVELARGLGAKIFNFEWCNDFAAARNFSIENATCDWILVLDADEAIDSADFEKIRALINDPKNCCLFTQRHYTNDPRLSNYIPCKKESPKWEKSYAGYFESSLVRLFPRKSDVRYEGKVHELIEYGIKNNPSYTIVNSGIRIHHYGHTPEVTAKKDKRGLYSGLGEAKLDDSENAWKNYFELGIEYNIGGKLNESCEALIQSSKLNPYYIETWINLGYVQCELGKYEEAIYSLKNALTISPRSAQAYCNLGVVYLRQSNFKLAERCFTNAVILDQNYVNAFCNLGKALAYMNRFSEAAHFYKRALDLMPNCPTAIEDLKVIYESSGLS
jgi:glycosyltransferase involved in cell wall biosynthesis